MIARTGRPFDRPAAPSCHQGCIRKSRIHNRCPSALEAAFGLFRHPARLVFEAIPANLLRGGRPRTANLTKYVTGSDRGAKIDQAEFEEFLIVGGEMGRL